MDGIVGETLSPSEEIKAGEAELLRGNWLVDTIEALKRRAEEREVELPGTLATSAFAVPFSYVQFRF